MVLVIVYTITNTVILLRISAVIHVYNRAIHLAMRNLDVTLSSDAHLSFATPPRCARCCHV
jgi:hypothetical protein